MGRRGWMKSSCRTVQHHPRPKQAVPFLVQWQTPSRVTLSWDGVTRSGFAYSRGSQATLHKHRCWGKALETVIR